MKTKTVWTGACILGGLAGLGLMAWYVYGTEDHAEEIPCGCDEPAPVRKQEPEVKRMADTVVQAAAQSPGTDRQAVPPKGDEFPLRMGSEGKRVERLQVWLLRNFGWTGTITGVFDKKTETQLKRHLKTDRLDEATYHRLDMDQPVHHQQTIR